MNLKLVKSISQFVTDQLIWLLPGAGAGGYILAGIANGLAPLTPFLLALMVAGAGLTLPLADLVGTNRYLPATAIALAAQLGLLPLFGFALYQLWPLAPALGLGLVALGVAPSEITSALMVLLSGGNLGMAVRLMALSLLVSTFTTPIWLGLLLGQSLNFDFGAMVLELGLIVSLPLLVSSLLRTRFPTLAQHKAEFGGMSAAAVIILMFILGGSLANYPLSLDLLWLTLACVIFNLGSFGLGFGLARILGLDKAASLAMLFTGGMREFGIASTVALTFLPTGAALAPAIYGLIMLLSATALNSLIRPVTG